MAFSSPEVRIQRARPLLGTQVSIRIEGLDEDDALQKIEAGFAEIARIHGLMSFHEHASDVSRLNRGASAGPVQVDSDTFAVLRFAHELSTATDGVFDISVGGQLVAWGFLPCPDSAPAPHPSASWCDIELLPPDHVRFRRPLAIDLGGIAKGFAVDRAIQRMALSEGTQCCVNAGGDLRLAGPRAERILLRTTGRTSDKIPMIELENGSLASSSGRANGHVVDGHRVGPHLDAVTHRTVGGHSFVSVAAESCMTADALTKIVLVKRRAAVSLLHRYGATAYLHTPRGGWQSLGGNA